MESFLSSCHLFRFKLFNFQNFATFNLKESCEKRSFFGIQSKELRNKMWRFFFFIEFLSKCVPTLQIFQKKKLSIFQLSPLERNQAKSLKITVRMKSHGKTTAAAAVAANNKHWDSQSTKKMAVLIQVAGVFVDTSFAMPIWPWCVRVHDYTFPRLG